jgi:hypothetical protein
MDMELKTESRNIVRDIRELIPHDKKHVSNSLLGNVNGKLLGEVGFVGGERFLAIGSEVHRRVLEPDEPPEFELTASEDVLVSDMVEELGKCQELTELLSESTNEVVRIRDLYGTPMKVIIDILLEGRGLGADIKTTSARTEKAFRKSIEKFDYVRQAAIYMMVEGLDEFKFVAVTKKKPMKVFIIDMNDYVDEMEYYKEEVKILLDAIKTCGRL